MLSSSLLPFLTLISPITSLSLPIINTQQQNQQPLSNSANVHNNLQDLKTHFRDIELKDLPAITTILVEAFSPSATWHYLMPDLQHHKPEVWACLHAQTEHAWRTRNKTSTFGKVITVAVPRAPSSKTKTQNTETEAEAEETPVSFSLWSIRHRQARDQHSSPPTPHPLSLAALLSPSSPSDSSDSSPCPLPPGTNLTRALHLSAQTAAVEKTYFTTPYAHQFYLNLLATHPSWDGHGFGARHVRWGQNLSLELERSMPGVLTPLPVTLLASPAGYPLYDSLGFESVKNATMEMLDGLGELWVEVMRWGWVGEGR